MRKDIVGSVVLFAIVALLVLRPWEGDPGDGPAAATALVTRAIDGDTVEARIGGEVEDVRLIGVDTPETVKPGEPVECFGPAASRFAKERLTGQRVRLVYGVEQRDTYGRLLAYLYLAQRTLYGSGDVQSPQRGERLFNAELLRRGLARSLTIAPNDRFAERFQRLELAAARAGRGLWGSC